jgi:muconate cycloisomerase
MKIKRRVIEMLSIDSITIHKVKLPFRFSFAHHLARRNYSENIVVQVKLSNGIEGFGEGIPRQYVTGENIDKSYQNLQEVMLPKIYDLQISTKEEIYPKLKTYSNNILKQSQFNSSWCALELALLDALSKSFQTPLSSLLKESNDTNLVNENRYGAVLPFAKSPWLELCLLFYKLWGFKTVKLKLGQSQEVNLKAVKAARRILGPKAILRADANCAWSEDECANYLSLLAPYQIASIEQPLEASDLAGASRLQAKQTVAIIADESLCSMQDAQSLISKKACSGFNIRISKLGGLINALEIAHFGQKHGISIQLGAQVGESAILSAAGQCFSQIFPHLLNAEGSNNLFLLKEDLSNQCFNVGYAGKVNASKMPGLGVEVNQRKLRQLSYESRTFSISDYKHQQLQLSKAEVSR